MDDGRLVIVLHYPQDGIVTGNPYQSMTYAAPLPEIGERIRVRTCESYQEYTARVISVDSARRSYRARIDG